MIFTCIRKKIAEVTLFSFTTIRTLANNRIKAKTAESIRSANFVGYKLGASSLQRTEQMVVLVSMISTPETAPERLVNVSFEGNKLAQ